MDYTFQDGGEMQPVSFLNELRKLMGLTTTTTSPLSTSSFPVTSFQQISGSAEVISKLVFNSSSPVPSEALVLSAINILLESRVSQLKETVKLMNVSYEKISDTSYAVFFTFTLNNISMPEDPELRNNTYQQVQDMINNALNTLLNDPSSVKFEPNSSTFTSTSDQIHGNMDYTFHDGDEIQPVSFLNELRKLMGLTTTTTSPLSTSSFPVTSFQQISGSAEVTSKLVFNSSSPVPSEALVLSAINILLESRVSQLKETVKLMNVSYEKISDTSYAVFFTFTLSNISVPEEPELRNNTYQQVQDMINNALNTLLNDPSSVKFEPNSSNFTSTSDQIDGNMDYTFQDGDEIQPVSFLNELRKLMGLTTTTTSPVPTSSFPVTSFQQISGSAEVTSKLVFNSSSPVPSEALVLSAINILLESRVSQLKETVKLMNVSYEKISDTSYAVFFTFTLSNISMSEDPELRNNTYQQVQDIINNALNTLLNDPSSVKFEPSSSNFMSTSDQVHGNMDYTFQDGDEIQPVSFLNELRKLMGLTTTTSPLSTSSFPVTSFQQISGSADVTSKLLFNSSSPVPSEALVLSAINILLESRVSQLKETVKLGNVIYEKISDTSYAVVFTFTLSNISMPEDPELKNNTYQQVQDMINNALNTLLNDPNSVKFEPNSSNFTSTSDKIFGNMDYTFQDGGEMQPVSFLNELRKLMGLTTTTTSPLSTSSFPVTSFQQISGSAEVTSKLVFNSSSPVPSEALVLSAINILLESRVSQLKETVKLMNVSYEKISDASYAVFFTFTLSNISMPEDPELRNNTYKQVQDMINDALNTLLNDPSSVKLDPSSSNFTSTSDQIHGNMDYTFHDGDEIQPVSFLNELRKLMGLSTTTISPLPTSNFPVTSFQQISGSADVTSKLLFNSSSPVPSEALVLSAINILLESRVSQLKETVKLVNVSYEKISDTSYAVFFTFTLSNISMPEDPELRYTTYQQVQDMINDALNTLLNDPNSVKLYPSSSNYTSTSDQIHGNLEYTFQDGDEIQPVSFLNELRKLMGLTTTTSPLSTSSFPVTSFQQISGSAELTSKLVFNSSSPVPSEALVLSAINILLESRVSQLKETVKLMNVSYEKISDTSYAVFFTFTLSNISMPEDPELRNNSYKQVQDMINDALNTLLNDPSSVKFDPNSSTFMSTSDQIHGNMDYTFQDGDEIQPVSFLNELHKLMGLSTTTSPVPTISGSAEVTSKLVFNSSSPVPSEALVLSAINILLESRVSQLKETVKLGNVSYEKISDTSYAVFFTFTLSSISMPEDPELRNNTYKQVQDMINDALNTLLNDPNSVKFEPNSSNFISTSDQIHGSMDYTFQDGDDIQPVSFLNELHLQNSLTTPSASNSQTTTDAQIFGTTFINIRLVFETLGLMPSESRIMELVSILNTNLTTKQDNRATQFGEPVSNVNVSYNRISNNSYALNFGYVISNVLMSEKYENRNSTYKLIQNKINKLLNEILNNNTAKPFQFDEAIFSNNLTEIMAFVEYNLSQKNDIQSPSTFLKAILIENGLPTILGKAIIYIKLVFITSGSIPSESDVLHVANNLLDTRLRTKRDLTVQKLSDPVSFVNVTYTKISDNSYSLNFGFEISNVSMSEKLVLRDSTYTVIQDSINKLLNVILNDPNATPFVFKRANFTGNSSVIEANVEYVFSDKDFKFPSPFLQALITVNIEASNSTTPTPFPSVVNTTGPNNSTSAAWVVAIIVPCAIAILLVPCWILLCCLLCGCCARIRRRWHRRRSYNVQYTTRHSLF
ncbi:uncharacterized protein [Misgurnus anguillicaudatus]|uniref:uncharacterized protein isoform X2 n=1 Tax=Misgurnus anguillicaudatus TaxID=75329 RepID=UPI003CCFB2ED